MKLPTVSLYVTLALLCAAAAQAETATLEWARQIGSPGFDFSHSVALDGSGSVYISGYTHGSIGAANAGLSDAFLKKFDSSGNELWTRQIGSNGMDHSYSVAVDGAGNVYISGDTEGKFGAANAGLSDAFLTKFDSSGNELWTRQIGSNAFDYGLSVALDAVGNPFITGTTYGSIGAANAGKSDGFLTKFDNSGNELWSEQIGTSVSDGSLDIAVDATGNAFITGYTYGSLGGDRFGRSDAFLTMFDSSGNEQWTRQIGSSGYTLSGSVAVDAAGNIYISGYNRDNLEDPSVFAADPFLMKFDSNGRELWAKRIDSSNFDLSYSVAVDTRGNVYISGSTDDSFGAANASGEDAFLMKFDSNGDVQWTERIGTSGTDYSTSIAVDAADVIYISGNTYGSLGGVNAGDADAFLIKYRIVPEPTAAVLAVVAGVAGFAVRRRG